ncbi:MAG TPA: 3-deoxy-D-manno-octulosonic acid transferase [Verrucomicrobiae bacterium]|jgi:3-deoxy-D-manno-octulosonic-acid transferase
MRLLYDILFTIGFVLSAPYHFFRMWRRGNWEGGFLERFGIYEPNIKSLQRRNVLWIHAVSVGEANLCVQLVRALEPRLPKIKIVVSTTTTTGMAELRRRLSSRVIKIYYPVDSRICVARALKTINPEAIVLVESEVWPNFFWQAQKLRIPLFLANARLSDKSYRGYKRFAFLFKPLFASFTAVGAQSEADAGRLREIGCRPEAVRVLGNMKFDAAKFDKPGELDVSAMLRQLGVPPDAPILLGGSTHAGEELILAEMARRLRVRFPKLFLVLVPRHHERCKEVGRELRAHGVTFIYRREIIADTRHRDGDVRCLLVDTTGELRSFYEHATVVFVGKSLTAAGGQNPIEPGTLGKAMVFGPNMQNFADIARSFVAQNGAARVRSAEELEEMVAGLLANEGRRSEMGRNAQRVIRENLGAVERTAEMILENLQGFGIYVAPKQ